MLFWSVFHVSNMFSIPNNIITLLLSAGCVPPNVLIIYISFALFLMW